MQFLQDYVGKEPFHHNFDVCIASSIGSGYRYQREGVIS